jgi:hypothetical protein
MIRTVTEARVAALAEPKRWKYAVIEATTFPLLDAPDALVSLYCTKKGAYDAMRDRKDALVGDGYKQALGALGRGLVKLEKAGHAIGLGLDYAGRAGAITPSRSDVVQTDGEHEQHE